MSGESEERHMGRPVDRGGSRGFARTPLLAPKRFYIHFYRGFSPTSSNVLKARTSHPVGHLGVHVSEYAALMSSSSKASSLDPVHYARYKEKLSWIDGIDPYEISGDAIIHDVEAFPKVTYPDIVNYLLFNPSPFTLDDMRAYKSLEAYNQFVCGWVKELGVVWVKDDTCVLVANVSTPVDQTDKV